MSKEAKFTKGPWFVVNVNGAISVNDHKEFPSDFPIAAIRGPLEDKEANGHLISSAPDLYAALEELLSGERDTSPVPAVRAGFAALAKARGETL